MDVSVIIPTLQRDAYLKSTLEDLCKQEGEFVFEIIVMDQNPIPAGQRDPELYSLSTAGHRPRIRWIPCPGRGVVYARNKAVAHSEGGLLVFIDDDVRIPDTRFLANHLTAHVQSDQDIAAVCGREVNPGRSVFTGSLGYKRKDPLSDILHFPRNYAQRTEATVLSTCNCSIRKKALVSVGCFDENFGGASYGDDADLALRMFRRGFRIVYDPAPALVHLMAPTGGLRSTETNRTTNLFSHSERVVSAWVFYFKHIQDRPVGLKLFYLFHHILRRSMFLKANVLRPWRQPLVVWGLFQAFSTAREATGRGHRFSFQQEVGRAYP